ITDGSFTSVDASDF
ncbi:hypothetical protein Tco_0612031, partial [Tanacetum coccineum]